MKKSFRELEKESNDADEIIPGIFLGSQYAAEDYPFLKKKGITVVINASNHIPNYHKSKGITYVRVPVDDSLKNYDINKMTAYLPYIVEVLRFFHHTQKKNVLIHCAAGVQRSAVIVASYLVKYYKKTPMSAIRYIITKRPIAFHNGQSLNFIDSLKNFHTNIKRFDVIKTIKHNNTKPRVIKAKRKSKKPKKKSYRKIKIR